MDYSVVIPAYNERRRLPATLTRVIAYLRKQSFTWEIIVVDDGSTDGMAEALEPFADQIRLIRYPTNLGKGAAVRTGMLAAQGDWCLISDADLSTPIEELERLAEFRDRYEVIIGSRRVPGARIERPQVWWKVLLGRLGNVVIQTLVVPGIHDTRCGFKLFSRRTRRVFELQRLTGFGFDDELLWLARRLHFRLVEVPVRWTNDEQSKVAGRDYLRSLAEIAQIYWHRLRGRYPTR